MNSIKCVHKYTYDIYGRQHTRSFDTDFSKEGFERTETYHYNERNQSVRVDRDILGQGGDIDGYSTSERNSFGQEVERKTYSNAEGVLESQNSYEYNQYGQRIKQTIFNLEGNPIRINQYEFDSYGREIKVINDLNANGIYDASDSTNTSYRDTDPNGTILYRIDSFADPNRASIMKRYYYDEFGRRNGTLDDHNQNGQIDAGEENTKISFIGDTSGMDTIEFYNGKEFSRIIKTHRSDNAIILGTFEGRTPDKVYSSLSYDGYGGVRYSSTEDYTENHFHELFEKVGGTLKTLNMSNANYKTDITLDNNVLVKLTQSELVVNGEGTDTIRLKDSNEFKQLANVTRGRHEYEQYQTEVDGQTYTLLIDTDINVIPM